jgi:thiol-disulfide isomerase/thioredoxin
MSPIRCVAAALLISAAPRLSSQAVGSAAPDFALTTLTGDTAILSRYRGHPVMLNFWASWCSPCRDEMHEILAVYDAHRVEGLIVLAINMTDQERMKDVRKFVSQLQLTFPVVLDERGTMRDRYLLRGIPTSMFIDSAGVVRLVHQGPITAEAIHRGLAMILVQ